MRFLLRLVFLLVAVALLAVGGGLAWFSSWRAERMVHLNSASSIAETTAGNVEFLHEGDGPAVLVFHGAPGGYDQAMLFGSSLAERGYQVVAPSRPGYLRTPLTTGLTPEKQADAMAALLDTLGIDNVAVMGVSVGAPAAIEFCLRYPNRAWALVLISAATKKTSPPPAPMPFPKALSERLTGAVGSWFLVRTAAADPPLEPPGTQFRSQGLAVFWNALFSQDEPMANSSMLSRPAGIKPLAFSLATTVES